MNKKGLCPLRCRMTFQKKRRVFSTGLFINPDHWNNGVQIAEPSTPENNIINTQLSLISQKISEAFLMLQVLPDTFDVDDIYRKYKGEDVKTEITILGAYDLHNEKMKKLIGVDFNQLSWRLILEKSNNSNELSLNLDDLSDSLYLISIDTEHSTIVKKIIKKQKLTCFNCFMSYKTVY